MTLLDAIAEFGFDACIGGARRDEEKARAKERIFSFRDAFGQWDPKNQRPELWNLYNARVHNGEHVRVFPISNWTELDVWQYIARERLEVPSIYLAHTRPVVRRGSALVPVTALTPPRDGETVEQRLGALSHRRRHHLHGAGRVARRHARGDHRRDRGHHDHRARRDAARRPDQRRVDGTAQESGVFLMSAIERLEVLDHGVLRFLTAGSVDDGKSTLIGRLLYDTKAILADQLAAIERTSQRRGQALDLSLLTDGLTAEREQGITIDVAYRYFATALRKFIIADAPGHEQYTRNMVTAASTAQLAILLVDARHGVVTQTRRHATLAHLLGIPHLVVAVNKMDLVDYREDAFAAHRRRLPRLRRAHGHRRRALRADVGARPATWSSTAARTCRGTTARRCCRFWRPPRRRRRWPPRRSAFPVQYVARPTATTAARLHGPRRSGLDRASAMP